MQEDSFGAWLRKHRRMLDLTQQELADQVGCARITLRRIEADELKPSKELAAILLERLGVPADERQRWVTFARGLSGLPDAQQDPPSSRSLTNLPLSMTSFIGRSRETDEITARLNEHRLVTLVGPGGVGKTRLALEVGGRLLAGARDGVRLVELAPLAHEDYVPQAVASALGIRPVPDLPLLDLLVNQLRTKSLVLIMDNCEHVVDAAAVVADRLLRSCAGLRVLATSREPLGVGGEAVYPVLSMKSPEDAQVLEIYRASEAVHLFEERARLMGTGFELTVDNAPVIAAICRRLDGVPLAIELAAGRISLFSAAEILAQLDMGLRILSGGSRTALPRQQTIQASIDWSWNLLAEPEKVVLRRLAVFPGSWRLDSAEAVCGGDAELEVEELIGRLVRKSLVQVQQVSGRETRCGMHAVARQYALEKLAEAGESETLSRRHLGHFLAVAEEADAALHGPDQQRQLARLDDELPNLRTALETALDLDPAGAVRLAAALGWYWYRRGLLDEGSVWFDRALRGPVAEHQDPGKPGNAEARMYAYFGAGLLAHFRAEYTLARDQLENSRSIGLRLEDPVGIGRALRLLGMGSIWQGDIPSAARLFEESIVLLRASEAGWDLCEALNAQGFLLAATGRTDAARESFEESLAIARSSGDLYATAMPLANLGSLAYQHGRFEEGRALLEESLAVGKRVADPTISSWALKELGHLAFAQGDLRRAASLYEEVLAACRDTNFFSGVAEMLRVLGDVAIRERDFEKSRTLLRESSAVSMQQGDFRNLLFCAWSLAVLAAAEERWTETAGLLGLVSGRMAEMGMPLPPAAQDDFERLRQEAYRELGEAAFDAQRQAGAEMSLVDGVKQALDEVRSG